MKKSAACIKAILLATLLASCASAGTEYIERPYVPEISFPVFPVLEDAQENADGSITVSREWIVELAEYKIRIEETESNYSELEALYKSDCLRK